MKIEQIAFIDQTAGDLGVPAEIGMECQDPVFAYEIHLMGRDHRLMQIPGLIEMAEVLDRTAPAFIFHNQLRQSWRQQGHVVVLPGGSIRSLERSSLTLQAISLDTVNTPFNGQILPL